MANKYRNRKTQGYDSRKEYYRALQLRQWQAEGKITDLREQVKFLLLPKQTDANGKLLERAAHYIADFVYTDASTGNLVVEDVKGTRTAEYRLKRKLMQYFHHITIYET